MRDGPETEQETADTTAAGADWDPDDEDLDERHDEGPIDLRDLDVESWHPRLARIPPLSLLAWVFVIPLISWWVRTLVTERALREDPDQLAVLDAWGLLIVIAVVAGLGLAIAVPVATRIARHRDTWVLALLQHGFQVGAVGAIVVIALHTALIAGITFGAIYVVTGTIAGWLIGVVLLGGLAALAAFAATAFAALRDPVADEVAIALDRVDAPVLHDALHDLAARVGVDPPTAVLIGPSMSWWTARGTVTALDGPVQGTVIHVSLPQLHVLDEGQVHGILAHELAHQHGDQLDAGVRLARAYDRMLGSVRAVRAESMGISRLPAKPALSWLDFALASVAIVVGERRRISESQADAAAVQAVGGEAVGTGLILGHALSFFEDAWAERVERALDGTMVDPVGGFRTVARNSLNDATAEDVIQEALGMMGPQHPALITRLLDIGEADAPLVWPEKAYAGTGLADPKAITRRLLDAMRPRDPRSVRVVLNEPRLTAAALGWLIGGLAIGILLAVRIAGGRETDEALLQIAVVLGAIWLLFPVLYPWLQREAVIDQRGIRLRSWWARWLDADAQRFPWSELRWSDTWRLKVDSEARMTLTDGTTELRWWGTVWPKTERTELYEALHARGVQTTWTSDVGETEPGRHAVLYVLPDQFVIPELRRMPDGDLVEVQHKIKSVPMHERKLAWTMIDRLHDPVPTFGGKDEEADLAQLAAAASMTPEDFQATANRVVITGTATTWTVEADGKTVWNGLRDDVDKADMDEVIWALMPFRRRTPGVDEEADDEAEPEDEDEEPDDRAS